MTPITHGLISWITANPLVEKKDRFLVTSAGLIPDIDGIGAIISIDYYAKYHHVLGHNLLFGILITLISLFIAKNKFLTAGLVLLSLHLHLLCDLLGSGAGWGVTYLWPFSSAMYEFQAPFQWELDSWQNLLVTAICIVLIIFISLKKNRTILEFFSQRLDKTVVDVFHKWFKKS